MTTTVSDSAVRTSNSSAGLTGYVGPRIVFSGNEDGYELWEIKFLARLRSLNLNKVIESDDANTVDADQNSLVFAELVQALDDRSLSLIIREARNDGRKSLNILREHYIGSSKPRIIKLYTELTSLVMSDCESTTDYMLRAEKASTSLKSAGETISDSLLIAMILKGLNDSYRPFETVITQRRDEVSFSEFKSSLRAYEESERARNPNTGENVMKVSSSYKNKDTECYTCGNLGHIAADCRSSKSSGSASSSNRSKQGRSKSKRWCELCKNRSHDTDYCRKNKTKVKTVSNNQVGPDEDDLIFHVKVSINQNEVDDSDACKLLVDTGATSHIIRDPKKFFRTDENFDSSISVFRRRYFFVPKIYMLILYGFACLAIVPVGPFYLSYC